MPFEYSIQWHFLLPTKNKFFLYIVTIPLFAHCIIAESSANVSRVYSLLRHCLFLLNTYRGKSEQYGHYLSTKGKRRKIMSLRTRNAKENRNVNKSLVKKYHEDLSINFDTTWLEKFQEYLEKGLIKFHFTGHSKERSHEKRIPEIPCEKFIKEGTCFEYKTIGDTLYRFAIRLVGRFKDYVAVFQPQIYKGKLEMWVVTYYSNNKNDTHFSLRTYEYAR